MFSRTRLDIAGVGFYASVTIGIDALPFVSYYDFVNEDLRITHCSNIACTVATHASVDAVDNVGSYTSVAIGTDGLPLISYYNVTSGDLKVAHCSDASCTGATIVTSYRLLSPTLPVGSG